MINFINIEGWAFKDTIQVALTIGITLLTYAIVYSLKPKLQIVCACWDSGKNQIKIKIKNIGRWDAVNLRIEVCAVDINKRYTYHFEVDHNEFLILPSGRNGKDNVKTFKVSDVAESVKKYNISYDYLILKLTRNKYKLRVRVHSYHSFSGLGKAEEEYLPL